MTANPAGGAESGFLTRQYDNADKLRIRYETHELYSERAGSFRGWAVRHLELRTGDLVCDVGCGPGAYHRRLHEKGTRVIAIDSSLGMLFDVGENALARSIPVSCVQASAEGLPLADASCERVLAAHMLYHVPQPHAALEEMRRVLKPGGRAVITANGGASTRLEEIEAESASSLGATPLTTNPARRFSLDRIDLVRSVFPGARLEVREDALVFPASEPVMRYWHSFAADEAHGDPQREALVQPLGEAMAARIDAIIAREGVFRVAKVAGCFIGDV